MVVKTLKHSKHDSFKCWLQGYSLVKGVKTASHDRPIFLTKMQYALCIILYKDNNLFLIKISGGKKKSYLFPSLLLTTKVQKLVQGHIKIQQTGKNSKCSLNISEL